MFREWEEDPPYAVVQTRHTAVRRLRRAPSFSSLALVDQGCRALGCPDCGNGSGEGLGCGWALVQQRPRQGDSGPLRLADAGAEPASTDSDSDYDSDSLPPMDARHAERVQQPRPGERSPPMR